MTWTLGGATVGLGVVGHSSPALADFTAFNTLVAPRSIDLMLFLQNLDAEPIYYSAYKTWATGLGATMCSTMSPGTHKLSDFTGGSFDTSGLNSGGLHGLALDAAAAGGPIILRLAHEFNGNFGSPYGYTKETAAAFVAAWRHIHGVFTAAGATNVLWFWCPNIWGTPLEVSPTVDPTVNDGSGSNWYPGDAYVDIIGLDGYETVEGAHAHSPADLFLANYTTLTTAIPTKPFAIGEFGCAEESRLSTFGGKAGWYDLFFSMVKTSMPRCAFVNQWQRAAGGDDWTISSSGTNPTAATNFVLGVNSEPFVPSTDLVLPRSALRPATRFGMAGGMSFPTFVEPISVSYREVPLSVTFDTPDLVGSALTGQTRLTSVSVPRRATSLTVEEIPADA